jgi:RimJ/RimL family protein N-acetyltransferase
MAELSVQPMQEADVEPIVSYWTRMGSEDLERMGVDPARVPSAEALRASLAELCRTPEAALPTCYLIWRVDGAPVGYASLKDIRRGETGSIHLHIWDPEMRGKGYGRRLFARSALYFYERFALGRIVCEPKAGNPMPNRLLRRSGYALLGTRTGTSSELSRVCELNVYLIDRRVAERAAA